MPIVRSNWPIVRPTLRATTGASGTSDAVSDRNGTSANTTSATAAL
jgi:hypothetical protein